MMPVRISAALIVATLASALPAGAQDAANLRRDFQTEARLLEAEIDSYFDNREREQEALDELSRLSRQLDAILGDAHGSVADLFRFEGRVAAARERAVGLSEESAEIRRQLYEGMKRLSAMAGQLERLGVGPTEGGGVGGTWHVEASPNSVQGLMDLEQDGTLISGDYQLSNGTGGSVVGTFTGGRLELQLIDSQRGVVGSIRGDLDAESGEIYGTWQARELAAGRPTAGHWTARRLPEDAPEETAVAEEPGGSEELIVP